MPKRKKKPEPKKRKKPGTPSFRDVAKLPKNAGHATQVQHQRSLSKSESTMRKYRNGWNILWRTIPRVMKRQKVKPPGSYDFHNHHGGVMFGWPQESTLTDGRVSKIFFAYINSGKSTHAQLDAVQKCLSFAWELTGQKTKKRGNWPCVASILESVRPGVLKPNAKNTGAKARYIPSPEQLKAAIERGWTPEHEWPLPKWCTHYIAFWDTMVSGYRARVDMEKIKMSSTHDHDWTQGWQKTNLVGGRSKLSGKKKGTRPWACYRVSDCQTIHGGSLDY